MYASEQCGGAPCSAELQAADSQGASQDPSAQTAFRIAEKRYQLHTEQVFKQRGGRRVSKGFVVRQTDFSDVLDPQPGGLLPPGVTHQGVPSGMPPTAAAFTFAAHPGLLLVRGALQPELQRQLIMDAFTRFCEPPNHTNHTRAYSAGLPGIWAAAQRGLRLQPAAAAAAQPASQQQAKIGAGRAADVVACAAGCPPVDTAGSCPAPAASSEGSTPAGAAAAAALQLPLWSRDGSGPPAAGLLAKLRWATLGPPYDWTQRLYLRNVPHTPLPPALHQLAVALAGLAAQLANSSDAAAPGGGPASCGGQPAAAAAAGSCANDSPLLQFCPDAALVNFYYEGDTLNGHIDDAEPSLAQSLVSLSLGCDAVFLMGGPTRDTPPTPLLLRGGDAVVLSGPARRCYHGVPRVLADAGRPQAAASLAASNGSCGSGGGSGSATTGCEAQGGEEDAFAPFARHMQRCRINISIRDTR